MRARFLDLISGGRRGLPLALALVALAAASPAQAASVNFLQLGSTTGTPVSLSNNILMVNAAPISFISNGLPGVTGTVNGSITILAFVTNQMQTTLPGGVVLDTAKLNGSIMITSPGGATTYLAASFTNATFSGVAGASSANINASNPGAGVTYSSSLAGFNFSPDSFNVNLANILSGVNFTAFTADVNGGGFNGTSGAVPEPASVAMVGTGLAATGLLVVRRKRRQVGEPSSN